MKFKKHTLFCRLSYSTLRFGPIHLGSPTHLSLEFFRAGPAHNNIPAQATPTHPPPRFTAAATPRRAAVPCTTVGCPPVPDGRGGEAPPVPPPFPHQVAPDRLPSLSFSTLKWKLLKLHSPPAGLLLRCLASPSKTYKRRPGL
jgi:hypothetical protein